IPGVNWSHADVKNGLTNLQMKDGSSDFLYYGVSCADRTAPGQLLAFARIQTYTLPTVNGVYWGAVHVRTDVCSGDVPARIGVYLPPNTAFAISSETPLYCWEQMGAAPWGSMPDCPTDVSRDPTDGLYYFGGPNFRWIFENGAAQEREIQFPLASSKSIITLGGCGTDGADAY